MDLLPSNERNDASPPLDRRALESLRTGHDSSSSSPSLSSPSPSPSNNMDGKTRQPSPTGVTDERLLALQNNDDDHRLTEPTSDAMEYLPLIPVELQQRAVVTYHHVHEFVQDKQKNFVLDRKAITTMIFGFLASVMGFLGIVVASIGGLGLVTCPIWLPIALLTLPLWLPFLLFTSPVWLTATVTILGCVIGTCGFVLAVAFFFTWPEEWLPSQESAPIVRWYLKQRDAATMALAKLQAKFILYAAGVGPAADAMFVIMDKVDFQAVTTKLQQVDWKAVGQKVQGGEFGELKKILFEIVGSLIR